MTDEKVYYDIIEEGGVIRISDDVLAGVSAATCLEIEGVIAMAHVAHSQTKGVYVQFDEQNNCKIDLHIVTKIGTMVSDVAQKVQGAVKSAVESASGIAVQSVNVYVAAATVK